MEIMTVSACFASGNTLGRYQPVAREDPLATLDAVGELVRNMAQLDLSEVKAVTIKYSSRSHTRARSVTYTNICGKIMHTGSKHNFRPSIQPFVQTISNGFGNFRGVFGMRCNLIMCGSDKCTLFRGATKSTDIHEIIEHSLFVDSIAAIYVHMLCATFRVGKPIYGMKNEILANAMQNQPYWNAHMQMQTEEKAYMFSFKITNFDKSWLETLLGVPCLVNSLLVNINFKGSVNLFLAVDSATLFAADIEEQFRPLLNHVRALIVASA